MQRLNEWLSTLLQVGGPAVQLWLACLAAKLSGAAAAECVPLPPACRSVALTACPHRLWLPAHARPPRLQQEKGADIYRSKGILNIAGTDDK